MVSELTMPVERFSELVVRLDERMDFIGKAMDKIQTSLGGMEKRQERFENKLCVIEERLQNVSDRVIDISEKQESDVQELKKIQEERTMSGFLTKHGKAVKWAISIGGSCLALFYTYEKFRKVLGL